MVRLSMSLVPGLHQSAWSLAGHSERISMSSIGRLGGFFGRSPWEAASHNLPDTWVVAAQACGGQISN